MFQTVKPVVSVLTRSEARARRRVIDMEIKKTMKKMRKVIKKIQMMRKSDKDRTDAILRL